jgi:Leucine-rich repeat (LRR) protein
MWRLMFCGAVAAMILCSDSQVRAEANLLHALDEATALEGKRPNKPEDVTALSLSSMRMTDAGLKELAIFKNVSALSLFSTKVTDAGLRELAVFKSLTTLDLRGTQVTDDGLKELTSLKNLATLFLDRTQVTEAGVKGLQKALPKCKIER